MDSLKNNVFSDSRSLMKQVRKLIKDQCCEDALSLLRDGLRRDILEDHHVEQAGRMLSELFDSDPSADPDTGALRILFLGQFTTSWLMSYLTAEARARGSRVIASEGEYDSVLQEIHNRIGSGQSPDVIVLAPWNVRLLHGDDRSGPDRIEDEMAFWSQVWGLILEHFGARIVQVGYDCMHPGAAGYSLGGSAYRAFQRHAKTLGQRGIVLAVCSKNNAADAREPFEKNPDMVLQLSDFAAFEARWDPKAIAIERISETLRLGMDSFVFFDDNPAEREHIRQALPMVEVVDVPLDPTEYVQALTEGLWFEAASVTTDDRKRSEQYRAEGQRRIIQESAGSLDNYLESLNMVADIRPLAPEDLQRISQLLGKTNQFNLTTRRHTRTDVQQMLDRTQNFVDAPGRLNPDR